MFVVAKGIAQVSGKKIDLFEVDEAPDSLSLSLFQAEEPFLHERTGHHYCTPGNKDWPQHSTIRVA